MDPGVADANRRGGAGGASGFDVSDVDLTNIPDPDCDEEFDSRVWNSCRSWFRHPGVGIAGSRFDGVSTSYIQVKNAPDDEAGLEALKQQLVPDYRDYGNEVEIIPVKYDFGELRRWSVILDRFAFSAGNTVSIVGGEVSINSPSYSERRHLWMNGVEPAGWDEWDIDLDGEELREILIVWAYDNELAAEALPELLPELGIPVDAVGLVVGISASSRAEISTSSADASENTVTVSTSASETAGEKVAPDPDANSESEPRTVPAAAPAESNGPAVNAMAAETDDKPDSTEPKQQAPAADSSGKAAGSSVTPKTSETDQDSRATPDQQSVSAATSDEQAVSEVIAKTSSETDRSDTRELNRQTAGDVTSSRSANPSWLLMSVAGVLVLAVLCAAIFAILRLRLRRA